MLADRGTRDGELLGWLLGLPLLLLHHNRPAKATQVGTEQETRRVKVCDSSPCPRNSRKQPAASRAGRGVYAVQLLGDGVAAGEGPRLDLRASDSTLIAIFDCTLLTGR